MEQTKTTQCLEDLLKDKGKVITPAPDIDGKKLDS
jgi:hypothetical protein